MCNFHNLTLRASPEKFPHGMKWLAEQIRGLGFRPGLWTVSFGTGDADFYKLHQSWFLHDPNGRPLQNWSGRYVLDPSQAAVRQYTETTHRQMARDWGYEFFKCDGMSGRDAGLSAHFFKPPRSARRFANLVPIRTEPGSRLCTGDWTGSRSLGVPRTLYGAGSRVCRRRASAEISSTFPSRPIGRTI